MGWADLPTTMTLVSFVFQWPWGVTKDSGFTFTVSRGVLGADADPGLWGSPHCG